MYIKGFAIAVVVLMAIIVALGAGILARLDGGTYVKSIQVGGVGFGGAATLGLMIASALGAW